MLKIFICIFASLVLISGCASEVKQRSMVGSGSFNAAEAAKTRVSLGLTYLQNGNFTQAKFNLDKALEFAPRSGDAHYAMAFYFEQVEELALAEESYQKALGYEPKNADIINSYGAFLCKQGNYENAKKNFLMAVNSKSYVSTAETFENLAICAQDQGLLQEAAGYFESALNHQPTRTQSLYLLAKLQTELGQFAEAKKTLWKYERNAQVNAESLFLSYTIARGMDDTKGALGYGELLKSMYPAHPNTETFKQQMGKFQPVAKVTNKVREVLSESAEKEIPSVSNRVTTASEFADDNIIIIDTTGEPQAAQADTMSQGADNFVINDAIDKTPDMMKASSNQMLNEAQSQSTNYHIVKPKENLYRISLQYNVKMQRIMDWNDITDPSSIRIGMKLWVKDPNKND